MHFHSEVPRHRLAAKNRFLKFSLLSALFFFLISANTYAQDFERSEAAGSNTSSDSGFNQALAMCPGGIVLGIFSANYEYLFAESHGLVARVDYETVPKSYTDANIESSGFAFILNYRWHINGNLESYYLGVYARYRSYSGTGVTNGKQFEFSLPDQTYGLNVGKRWIWNSGFTINLTFGYGFQVEGSNADPSNAAVNSAIDDFKDSYDSRSPFLGEFSIGFAF